LRGEGSARRSVACARLLPLTPALTLPVAQRSLWSARATSAAARTGRCVRSSNRSAPQPRRARPRRARLTRPALQPPAPSPAAERRAAGCAARPTARLEREASPDARAFPLPSTYRRESELVSGAFEQHMHAWHCCWRCVASLAASAPTTRPRRLPARSDPCSFVLCRHLLPGSCPRRLRRTTLA